MISMPLKTWFVTTTVGFFGGDIELVGGAPLCSLLGGYLGYGIYIIYIYAMVSRCTVTMALASELDLLHPIGVKIFLLQECFFFWGVKTLYPLVN